MKKSLTETHSIFYCSGGLNIPFVYCLIRSPLFGCVFVTVDNTTKQRNRLKSLKTGQQCRIIVEVWFAQSKTYRIGDLLCNIFYEVNIAAPFSLSLLCIYRIWLS